MANKKKKFHVYASIEVGKYCGIFLAETPEKAIEAAEAYADTPDFCANCVKENDIDIGDLHDFRAEEEL